MATANACIFIQALFVSVACARLEIGECDFLTVLCDDGLQLATLRALGE